jgi:hypothetical protein
MDKIPKDQIDFLLRHVAEIKEKKRKEVETFNKDLLVAFWPVSFTELPDIDDVSIEDDYRRLYTFQIGE